MSLLGIDFGLRKIGLALAKEGLAQPLGIIRNSPSSFPKIIRICQENKVEKIIVGLPQGRLVPEIKKFCLKLSEVCSLPIDFQDESLTTQTAIAKMVETGKKKKKRRRIEDAVAAACILQEYLEERR